VHVTGDRATDMGRYRFVASAACARDRRRCDWYGAISIVLRAIMRARPVSVRLS